MDSKHTILVVDDNRISRRITSSFLKSFDVETYEAVDGEEAIEYIKGITFSAVFMNLYLPNMNGYETTKLIRKLPTNSTVPVIAITSENLDSLTREMVEAGFSDVLSKPFVKASVASFLQSLDQDSNPVFDVEKYKKTYKDVDLQRDIIDTFLNEEESDTKRIEAAFKSKNPDEIYSAVHYLKGSFSYLKASKILIVTQHILDSIKKGDNKEALKNRDKFIEQYKELVNEIKNTKL